MKHILFAAALTLVVLPALAQDQRTYVGNCPRGLKYAAGACVARCPGGYEDRGRFCLKQSECGEYS